LHLSYVYAIVDRGSQAIPQGATTPASTASERAYGFAKNRILDGRFRGGELLSEGEVAELVGVSRTPVREAFLRLESEGLLRLYPKRGALVVPVSVSEVEDVMETRLLVERLAVERIGQAPADVCERLEAIVDGQASLARTNDARGFVGADHEFHRCLVLTLRNEILLALHDSLRDRESRMGLVALSRDPGRTQRIVAEHRALLRAIRAGDSAATTILTDHLEATRDLLRTARIPPS
jgi:DNA-binding GntR family transcriptional regulator